MKRSAQLKRDTRETKIDIKINIDGVGKSSINTGIEFFDHMLELFSRHSKIDLTIRAKGDLGVDHHHTIEDVGITLGKALKKALGTKAGIRRYGHCMLPMDESLVSVALDISNRPFLVYGVDYGKKKIRNFDPQLIEEFLYAFVINSGITLHVSLLYGKNVHHIFEAVFKGLAKAVEMAVGIDKREKGVPSTKGLL
ncbi:MAG: imidazoleglycerol-phosphate dehydratase HisB [Candidatus Ancaeobacter aquaticus]|nr:imidazoleglycerol-phosphate dehydratase HisB [Candidatus Ancaeobacter aquaticus]